MASQTRRVPIGWLVASGTWLLAQLVAVAQQVHHAADAIGANTRYRLDRDDPSWIWRVAVPLLGSLASVSTILLIVATWQWVRSNRARVAWPTIALSILIANLVLLTATNYAYYFTHDYPWLDALHDKQALAAILFGAAWPCALAIVLLREPDGRPGLRIGGGIAILIAAPVAGLLALYLWSTNAESQDTHHILVVAAPAAGCVTGVALICGVIGLARPLVRDGVRAAAALRHLSWGLLFHTIVMVLLPLALFLTGPHGGGDDADPRRYMIPIFLASIASTAWAVFGALETTAATPLARWRLGVAAIVMVWNPTAFLSRAEPSWWVVVLAFIAPAVAMLWALVGLAHRSGRSAYVIGLAALGTACLAGSAASSVLWGRSEHASSGLFGLVMFAGTYAAGFGLFAHLFAHLAPAVARDTQQLST